MCETLTIDRPRILVTGGAGYIGSHCCKELYKKGYHPIVVDNLITGYKTNIKWGEFFYSDIGDYNSIDRCFKKHKIEAVIHFAAFAYVGESMVDPVKYYENNVMKTINLLSCMINNNVKNIVFSSTCATYGNPVSLPIDEDHPQCPINTYGRTKLFIEHILKDYDATNQINYMILRYFNAAGADPDGEIGENHDPETHLIPLVLDVARGKRKTVKIYGDDYDTKDGSCIRDYIHVTDLANAHINALELMINGHESDFFNLGTGVGYSVRDIIRETERITGRIINHEIAPRRAGDPPLLIASNKKAVKKLNWKMMHSNLEDIIRSAWRFYNRFQYQPIEV